MQLLCYMLATAALTWAGIGGYVHGMNRLRLAEVPGTRGMHSRPLPVGAGVIPVLLVLAFWSLTLTPPSPLQVSLAIACAGLAIVSWVDDMVRLPAAPRLLAHACAVGWCLWQLAPDLRALPLAPLWLERAIQAVAWIWFINLFNFMDGIDGLAGSEAVAIAVGYAAIAWLIAPGGTSTSLALLLAAAMLAYLCWNWHPARVLMGDAGSIPIGFLTGWFLIDLAVHGLLAAAIILPLFFLADATYTLLSRMLRGELPHQPHRDHFYQRAALGVGKHQPVVILAIAVNLVFLALALLSAFAAWIALPVAFALAGLALLQLHRMAGSKPTIEAGDQPN